MEKEKLISVLVPVYRVEKYLSCCIDSILKQTYKNLEIILIDDGSPDGCPKLCDQYAKRDSRIKVIHKKNGGSSEARNVGLDNASGDYIIFVDGDDFIYPSMISDLYHAICRDHSEMALCSFSCVGENCFDLYNQKEGTESHLKDEVISPVDFWKQYYGQPDIAYVAVWNKLVHKDLYRNVRFPKGKMIDDEFVIYPLVAGCERITCIKENLYCYRKRNDSIMSSKFSIGHLDVVEARVERALQFLAKGQQYYSEKSLTFALSELMDAKRKLNLTTPQNRNRFNELRASCKAAGKQIMGASSSAKFKLAYLALLMGDHSYMLLMSIRRKI